MEIIDAHNHPDWHGHNLQKFLANMDRCHIQTTWLLSWECARDDYDQSYLPVVPAGITGESAGPIPFSRCLSYVERAPERFVLGYCPDLRIPDACQKLEAAAHIYNIKICGEVKSRTMYDNPDALRLFRLAGELRLPVVLHLQYDFQKTAGDPRGEWWGGTIDALERVLIACPDTIFLGHAPGFWIHISNDDWYRRANYPPKDEKIRPEGRLVQLLRKYSNLYCDISAGSGFLALSRDLEYTRFFLTEFQDRILYARDYFDNIHQELLNSLDLPTEILEKIYAENAKRLIRED